jgi:hypothetical protein
VIGVIISFNNIESIRTIQTGTVSTSSQRSRKAKYDEKTEKLKDIGRKNNRIREWTHGQKKISI